MKVGFIGLGHMGRGMALNLAKNGADLFVYARRAEALEPFKAVGVTTTMDLLDMAKSDILFLCVPNEKVESAMLCGENGLLSHMEKGKIIIDCSTISYLSAVEFAAAAENAGIRYMDAPISGMEHKANDGTLTFMCGGEKELFDEVKPLLHYMGTSVLYMGKSGCGQLSKMINNVLYDINMAAVAEMLPMAVKLGLNAESISDVINSSTGMSHASKYFLPNILNGEFMGTYSMNNAYKDMSACAEVCAKNCIPTPVMYAALTTYQQAMLMGYGDCGKGAMVRVYEDLNGVEARKA